MRKVFLAILAVILVLPAVACDSGGDGGGGAKETGTTTGLTITRTAVAYNKWVNAHGISVPYSSFGVANVSAGRGRGLPEGARVIVVTRPAHGTLSKSNTFYTPTLGYVGRDSFTFKLVDSSGTVYPDVCRIVFKKVDAEHAHCYDVALFPVLAGSNRLFLTLYYSSPGGVEISKVNSQSLTATASGTPVLSDPVIKSAGGDNYTIEFYGDFNGCTGNWVYYGEITIIDPAGNIHIHQINGATEAIN